ncbi:hypothetical protein IAT38_004530 [Cryptococcus sp. DSM 104549]
MSEVRKRAREYIPTRGSDYPDSDTWPSAFILVAKHVLQVHADGIDEKWWKLWDELRPVDTFPDVVPFCFESGAFLSLDDIVLRRPMRVKGEGPDDWEDDETARLFPVPKNSRNKKTINIDAGDPHPYADQTIQ